MNHKARNELIEVISGLVMLVAGIFLLYQRRRLSQDSLEAMIHGETGRD